MKVFKRVTAILFFVAFGVSMPAHAGIPVIDPTSIASSLQNAVQSYTQALKEYQTLQQQYAQMQQLENIASGTRGFNQIKNNPSVMHNISTDFNTAIGNIRNSASYSNERGKLPASNDPKTNAYYDEVATQRALRADSTAKSAAQVKELQAQKTQFDTAVDPAGRAESANAMAANKAIMDADNAASVALQAQQEQQRRDALLADVKRRDCLRFSLPSQVANCQ